MRYIALILAMVFGSCFAFNLFSAAETCPERTKPNSAKQHWAKSAGKVETIDWPAGLPIYDHLVIVVEENKDWYDIINNKNAPHINDLAANGTILNYSFGMEHHSQGNYYWLFSGSNQDVGFVDEVPTCENNLDYPFTTNNLAQQLKKKVKTFIGYSQSLPATGSPVDHTTYSEDNPRIAYARKHVPWTSFSNVIHDGSAESIHRKFTDFPTGNFDSLPTVSFVIPDLENDMHNIHNTDGLVNCDRGSVCVADKWLKDNLGAYYEYVQNEENNSLLIVTFDENNGFGYAGITDPLYPLGKSMKPELVPCKMDMDTVNAFPYLSTLNPYHIGNHHTHQADADDAVYIKESKINLGQVVTFHQRMFVD